MQPKQQETFLIKIVYVAVFLVSALVAFFATEAFSSWVKQQSDVLTMWPVQAILALPLVFLFFFIEKRVIWRLIGQDAFSTIYPVTMGVSVGYLIHYAPWAS